ncbi:MAG: sigma-54 dependent transcriptional regulator [Acidobacteria bacterium]|nr:sigma-54 dependent transcriptional regulator [Acidobacteriota bacterium]
MLVGDSTVMQGLRATVARVGATEFTALVEGESGVGKELVARALHDASPRRRGPFVAVNCAALVETLLEAELFGIEERTATGVRGRRGKFEQAEGGTLFLDEVADLSMLAQAKLLRVLQDMSVERVGGSHLRAVNTRVLAATNRRLSQQVLAGAFREDLFYRLSGVEIEVPPLRSRREDIPVLVEHLLHRHRHTRVLTASAAALDALGVFDWPGNVRQLERVLERAIALSPGDRLHVEDLPALVTRQYQDVLKGAPAGPDSLRAWSSRYVRLVLDQCEGNKTRACRRLDISYHTLRSHLQFAAGAPPGDARTP